MEVIINREERQLFNEVEIGETFTEERGVLFIKVSTDTALCFSDETVYYFKGNEVCTLKDCVIIERELLENLKRGAGEYE